MIDIIFSLLTFVIIGIFCGIISIGPYIIGYLLINYMIYLLLNSIALCDIENVIIALPNEL